jgi:hypothetical protein
MPSGQNLVGCDPVLGWIWLDILCQQKDEKDVEGCYGAVHDSRVAWLHVWNQNNHLPCLCAL